MILEALSMGFSIAILLAGFSIILSILMECINEDNVTQSFRVLFFTLIFGAMVSLPSFGNMVKNIESKYYSPFQIIRTNNVTHVIYFNDNKIRTESYNDAKYWNATNIQIKVDSGDNIWAIRVGDDYSVVIK